MERKEKRQIIIIVDDNAADLAAGKSMLKDAYDVFPVSSAEKLFALMEKITPDLILLDIEMPEMNGYEALKKLKNNPAAHDIPVIFLTARDDPGSEFEGLSLGAIDYISKPFSPQLLLKRMENHLLLDAQQKALKNIVREKSEQVVELQNSVLSTVAELVEFRDYVSDGQIEHTQSYLQLLVERLKIRLRQQELMAAISQSFISTEDFAGLVNKTLKMAGEFMGMERTQVYRFSSGTHILNAEYIWQNETLVLPLLKYSIPFEAGEFLYETFISGGQPYVACDDVDDRREFVNLSLSGVRSLLLAPIFLSGDFWGLLSFETHAVLRPWGESDIQLIRLIASVISAAITRTETEESLLRMSSIVNIAPQFISYITTDGLFKYVNPGAQSVTGYSAEELKEGGLGLLFDRETYSLVMEKIIPRILEKKNHNFEIPIIRKDGEIRILGLSSFSTGQESLGWGAIASDITEKKQLERDLAAAKEQA
ncbi:MAG: response regulator [Spirochaetales bacterium]|jgi:PAS domain S-box-containing protein|nr:response regulator [Spirochaetales bacterium]